MKVREVMLSHVYTCTEEQTIATCSRLMRDEKIGFVPVLGANGKVAGVVTDRDLVVRAIANDLPLTTPLRDVMTRGPLVAAQPDEELDELEVRLAKGRTSRGLVLDRAGNCVGVVSLSDIALSESMTRTGGLMRAVARRESVQIVRSSKAP